MSFQAHNVSLEKSRMTILDRVSMEVMPRRLSVLVGPNGAGKSSLLHVLSGDWTPTDGFVSLNGTTLESIPIPLQAKLRAVMLPRRDFAFGFSAYEVLEMGWIGCPKSNSHSKEEAFTDVVEACAVSHLLDAEYRRLSSGEQQRVHLARTILQVWPGGYSDTARYLLLDEPTENLDVAHELQIMNLVSSLVSDGLGVLAVLHDLELAARYADYAYLISDGGIVKSGVPSEVFCDEILTSVYGTEIRVEYHEQLKRPLILT